MRALTEDSVFPLFVHGATKEEAVTMRTYVFPFTDGKERFKALYVNGRRCTVSRRVGVKIVQEAGHDLPTYGLRLHVAYQTRFGWYYNQGLEYWLIAEK